MRNCFLGTVGIIYLEPVALGHQIIADSPEAVCRLLGKQSGGGLVTVNPAAYKVVGAEISYLQYHIRHNLGDLHKIISSYRKTGKLFPGSRHVLLEFRTRLKTGKTDTGCDAACVHVALPMGSGYHTAVTIFPSPRIDIISYGWIHLRKEHGGKPGTDGMAGWIASFPAQFVILAGKGFLLEIFKRADALEPCLWSNPDLVYSPQASFKYIPDCRSLLFRHSHAEMLIKLVQKGFISPDGIPAGHFSTHRILSLLLSPLVALDIQFEGGAALFRRGRKTLDEVGQLFGGEIHRLLLRPGSDAAKKGKDSN